MDATGEDAEEFDDVSAFDKVWHCMHCGARFPHLPKKEEKGESQQ